MPGKIETVAWDTCIFLAWLKNESRADGEMEGVAESLAKIESGTCALVTSAIIHTEIHPTRLNDDVQEKFKNFLTRSNIEVVPADTPVNRLAGELQEFYDIQKKIDGLGRLCTPDAIHLATALIYEVDAFYTFDDGGDTKCRGLIPLSGNVAGRKLTICKPPFTPPPPPPPVQHKLFNP
jgi:predicted nucleic acid-binding protein